MYSENGLFAPVGLVPQEKTKLEFVNLENGQHKLTNIENICRDIVPWNCTISKNELYFSNNIDGCSVGILNLDNMKISNEIELNLANGIKLYEPKYLNTEVFVKDTTNEIHRI